VSFDPELYGLAKKVVQVNAAAGRCITTAESCTGGLVAAALTEIPGSSAVFDRSFITYSNEAKIELLGVSEDILATLGAVSEATAWAMAQGALTRSKADVAVAVSGIAGPLGGSEKKPIGTVVFARALKVNDGTMVADTHHFGDLGRSEIRRQAALVALRLLLP
jgi:nicotinamide-nucleotide amidase